MQNKHTDGAKKQLSLKSRFLWAATLWVSIMVVAAGYLIPSLVKNYLVESTQEQMRLALDEITANLRTDPKGHLLLPTRLSDPRYSQPYSGYYWSASLDKDQLRSRSLWDKTLHTDDSDLKPVVKGARNEPLLTLSRTIYLPNVSHGIHITVGIDQAPMQSTIQQIMGQLWTILGLLFFGILLFISIQVSWSLLPLKRMQRELAALRNGDQSCLNNRYPQEVSPLADDLNALLFHYQELLERARNQSGNLSHALKTPLSVLKNDVAQLSPADRERLSEPLAQIQSQIDYHLGRARMAGSSNILSVKTDPSERIDAIAMAFDKVYAERDITLVNELDSDLHIAVEGSDFDEMIGNLLENAYKWSTSLIRVYTELEQDGWVNLCIEDNGTGIAPELMNQALQRGVRLDETTPGTGLGLNIVSEMAHSYRGKLILERGSLGGLKASLRVKIAASNTSLG
ncbi:ATP-binding protein [Vibrio palustris]|uniref:histidine kinase n=1 Tax=Vibrio palustris TaxID=1918946 RepID=A0A1R4B2T4_9VIBR|nr:ATP-binding protein [Vibrio palustris]SJL83225.1 Virulence sensor histidine kinase PhoQ [Vibrio palustris]